MTKKALVVRTIKQVAEAKGSKITAARVEAIAKVALNPPTTVANSDYWMDVTIRGLHSTYGGAVNHFKASVRKHGVVDAFVVKPVDPQMTFEYGQLLKSRLAELQ